MSAKPNPSGQPSQQSSAPVAGSAEAAPPAFSFAEFSGADKKEFWAALALKHTEGLGNRRAGLLLQAYGSAYQAIQNPDAWRKLHITDQVIEAFKSEAWRERAGMEWAGAKRPDVHLLLSSSPYYPAMFREVPDPPLFVYFKGNIQLLNGPCVGVVGARRASPDALAASARIGLELSKAGVTVISGLARGVDSEAHKAALQGPGATIAVLGCGLDVYYPRENRTLQDEIAAKGLLVSEYPPGTEPEAFQFPVRNRLISALSLGVLVVEAAGRSGSLITARIALEYGREVFAMPGKFAASKAQGSHDLIRKGAKPVLDLDDLLIELVPRLKAFAAYGEQAAMLNGLVEEAEAERKKARAQKSAETKTAHSGKQTTGRAKPKPAPKPVPAWAQKPAYPTASASDLATAIKRVLESEGPLQADSLCALLRVSAAKLSSELLMLELAGEIKRYPGMIYSLI